MPTLDGIHCAFQKVDATTNKSTCTVYGERPRVCNVTDARLWAIENNLIPPTIDLHTWHKHYAEGCLELQLNEQLGEEWRVVLSIPDAD